MRVFLVDSEPIFREGLKTVIGTEQDLTVVGEADNCRNMLQVSQNVDLLILDGELDSIVLLTSLQKNRSKGRPPFVLVLTKHNEEQHAVQMLEQLQGKTHEVLTAVAVAENGRLEQALDVSRVTFRPNTRQTLEAYVATGEPLDKAGAYAIQGLGAPLIERVEGDFFGVMGLPLRLALDLLAKFGRPYRFTR